jgi:hypothetical protein
MCYAHSANGLKIKALTKGCDGGQTLRLSHAFISPVAATAESYLAARKNCALVLKHPQDFGDLPLSIGKTLSGALTDFFSDADKRHD